MALLFFDKSKGPPTHWRSWLRHGWIRAAWRAQPPWASRPAMAAIYAARREGEVVDHVVPLRHPHVCGLHCQDNLQIVDERENADKSNHRWPDMWEPPAWLPLPEPEPHQTTMRL